MAKAQQEIGQHALTYNVLERGHGFNSTLFGIARTRASLDPMLEALGVPTSRAFSLIETGEALERGDEPSPTRSARPRRHGST